MIKKFTYLLILLAFTKMSFSQCSILISGNDFTWCQPCTGSASVTPLTGTPPFSYQWSTNDTTSFINNLCSGTYYVTVTDSLGCISTDSVNVNQMGTPMTVSVSSTAPSCSTCCDICINVTLTGGCPPYNYTWTPSDPNWPSPCIACAFQTYNVTVTDACGCPVSDSITTDTIAISTGVNNINDLSKQTIMIYPNPSATFIKITPNLIIKNAILEIIDLKGNVVRSFEWENSSKKYDIQDIRNGIYFVRILSEEKVYYQTKLIKK